MKRLLAMAIGLLVAGVVLSAALGYPGSPVFLASPDGEAETGGGGPGLGADPWDEGDLPVDSPSMETVWAGQHLFFGFEEPTYLVIQTQQEWEDLWAPTGKDPPAVDFTSRTVLVALYGQARTSGYDIEIREVVASSAGAVASVLITEPGSTCGTLQVLTFPAHMVSLPKSEGPFEFRSETAVIRCP